MKAYLMFRDCDFDPQAKLPWNELALMQDLELNVMLGAMALGDKFLFDMAKRAVLSALTDPDALIYRQNILKDCLRNPLVIRDIYAMTVELIENRRKHLWGIFSDRPDSILYGSVETLDMFMSMLRKLRAIVDTHIDKFESEGLLTLSHTLQGELSDEYFSKVQGHLNELRFGNGVLISADFGQGGKGVNHKLRRFPKKRGLMRSMFGKRSPRFAFYIAPRDESGARALSELRDRGINLVANAVAQSADHILSFFTMLQTELAFYVGCLNLHEHLVKIGEPFCFPQPLPSTGRTHECKGLYDVCLALSAKRRVVGNDLDADGKELFVITGCNQGGKSTFLRSIGLAQLMMQCGMFVPAESFRANVSDGLFTHYKREEDVKMESGKLDDEMCRMSEIVDHLNHNSLLLLNESFAATNEREGSEIARQITGALLEEHVKVFFVTHLFSFSHNLHEKGLKNTLFLRAERKPDGMRTFRVIEGEPLQTNFGVDLYRKIFGAEEQVRREPGVGAVDGHGGARKLSGARHSR
jgi:hypothetical protein